MCCVVLCVRLSESGSFSTKADLLLDEMVKNYRLIGVVESVRFGDNWGESCSQIVL